MTASRLNQRVVLDTEAHSGVPGLCEELAGRGEALADALQQTGSVLIPATSVRSPEDFAQVVGSLFETRYEYKEKATPRHGLSHGVFTSTDLPPAQEIRQHNENSYTMSFPGKLVFGCLAAPAVGGATPTCDVRTVYRMIDPELRNRFLETGWLLERNFSEDISLSWQDAYGVSTLEELERYCDDNRISLHTDGGVVRTRQRRSATITPVADGEPSWFNHVAFWSRWSLDEEIREVLRAELDGNLPFDTYFGDGTPLSSEEIEHLNDCYAQATVRHSWQVGDILVVDNMRSSHGREAFQGKRLIAVSMHDETSLSECHPSLSIELM